MKYTTFGASCILVLSCVSTLILTSCEKQHADKVRKAAAYTKQKKEVAQAATKNWEQWRQAFIGPERSAACFHGSNFTDELPSVPRTLTYTITCQVGSKGKPPDRQVICDQSTCIVAKME